MKTLLFGAGDYGQRYCEIRGSMEQIVAIADNDTARHGKYVQGHKVISPAEIQEYEHDRIVITLNDWDRDGVFQDEKIFAIKQQLLDMGIPDEKIFYQYVNRPFYDPRVRYLQKLAETMTEEHIDGCVAECGVFRGWLAAFLNEFFPKKELHLFDTFGGFNAQDVISEFSAESRNWLSIDDSRWTRFFTHGSKELVLMRCPNRQNVKIHQGPVPDTLAELTDQRFCFVNLDMDLYTPTLAALRFFGERMVDGGVILMHDYYHDDLTGIKESVKQYATEKSFFKMPIGDGSSLALIMKG